MRDDDDDDDDDYEVDEVDEVDVGDKEGDDDVEEENRSQDREGHFVRAGAVEMHMDMSQEQFCMEI